MSKKRLIEEAEAMPPLDHHPNRPGPWRAHESEVIRWLLESDEVRKWLFEAVKETGAIVFDPETKTWRGIGYEPDHGD